MREWDGNEIAIIGMAGRFPGAANLEQFWCNLRDGVESIIFPTEQELAQRGVDPAAMRDPAYVKAAAALDGMELFDAAFFGMSHREAELTDPQHRIFLECAWEALERSGYISERYDGAIGVFAGAATNTYLLYNLVANRELVRTLDPVQLDIANAGDFLTTRVSYKLNLTGPSHVILSACSTSLVAIHTACQSLLSLESDIAISGGATINVTHPLGYRYLAGGIASPDGRCRPFAADAAGTIFSSGVGVVVLKRLADALADGDTIHAIIRGTAINNDGAFKVGYTAPSVAGQAAVIAEALANAGVAPTTVGYVEAHGTGTAMGDPIEVQALTKAFGTERSGYCAIGTLKGNMGHLGAAAGVAGLIKTVLALQHRQIPPSLHVEQANPAIDFAQSPFYVNTRLVEWRSNGSPRRAGVSSFGIGGTNAHVVLEEAPPPTATDAGRPWHLLVLSAKTPTALDAATANLAAMLRRDADLPLADVAYTLQLGRRTFDHRRTLVCRDRADALRILDPPDPQRVLTGVAQADDRPVVFLFPGQGTQYVGMAAELYAHEPIFRAQVDHCAELLAPQLGCDIREILYPDRDTETRRLGDTETTNLRVSGSPGLAAPELLDQTWLAQPALFVIEYALAQLWMAWGVQPTALIGHSLGEYVAATLAGVFALADALALVAARGRLVQQLPPGAMLAVSLTEEQLSPLLGPELTLAAVNAPMRTVVSGAAVAIETLQQQLQAAGVECRRLHTSHAFHSAMLDPILDAFIEQVRRARPQPPQLRWVSNLTGDWITAAQATDAHYWARQLREPVRFADGLGRLLQLDAILLEVGPGVTLGRLARQHPACTRERVVLAALPHAREQRPALAHLLDTLGKLWIAGAAITWRALYSHERRRLVPLPTYPFERRRHWIAPNDRAQPEPASAEVPITVPPAASRTTSLHPRPDLLTPYVAPVGVIEHRIAALVQRTLGVEPIGVHDNFFDLGGDSFIAAQLIDQLKRELSIDIPIVRLYERLTIRALAEQLDAEPPDTTAPGSAGVAAREQKVSARRQHQQRQRSRKREDGHDRTSRD
jgi:acyl transferase domain-containing protein